MRSAELMAISPVAIGMSDGTEDRGAAADDPTDPLAVLGHELRMHILRALADADEPLTFTELREAVEVGDTGRFNYHLTRLCEYFVRETADGYELGHAGDRVIAAGRLPSDSESAVGPGEQCPICGAGGCEKLFHVHLTPPWSDRSVE